MIPSSWNPNCMKQTSRHIWGKFSGLPQFVVFGARDFSPEITVHIIGTEVPCPDKVQPLGMNHSVAYNLPEST